jgi:hypothetical protein
VPENLSFNIFMCHDYWNWFHCQVLSSVKPVQNSNPACLPTFVAPSGLYVYTQRSISLVGSCNISQFLDRAAKNKQKLTLLNMNLFWIIFKTSLFFPHRKYTAYQRLRLLG